MRFISSPFKQKLAKLSENSCILLVKFCWNGDPTAACMFRHLSVGVQLLPINLIYSSFSADSSASLPRAKKPFRGLRGTCFVFHRSLPQTSRSACFTMFVSTSVGAENKVCLSKQEMFRLCWCSLCRFGLHWATRAGCLPKHGATLLKSFCEPSTNVPQNPPAVLVLLVFAVGNCSFENVAFPAHSNTFLASSAIVSPCFATTTNV